MRVPKASERSCTCRSSGLHASRNHIFDGIDWTATVLVDVKMFNTYRECIYTRLVVHEFTGATGSIRSVCRSRSEMFVFEHFIGLFCQDAACLLEIQFFQLVLLLGLEFRIRNGTLER